MNAQEIINYIATAPKKTPVKIYVNLREPVDFASCGAKVFGEGLSLVVFGNWADLEPVVTANAAAIADIVIENDRRNSGVPLLDIRNIRARIEPGAVIREKVEIGEGAVIMMGAAEPSSARAPSSSRTCPLAPSWSATPPASSR